MCLVVYDKPVMVRSWDRRYRLLVNSACFTPDEPVPPIKSPLSAKRYLLPVKSDQDEDKF